MAIIDSNGLFLGDRLGWCSDDAQLHWPRLYSAANNYARLEVNYRKIVSKAYPNFKSPPGESEFWAMIREYKDNFLLLLYTDAEGVLWGQWQTNERYLLGHKNAEDRRSPTPPLDAQEAYRNAYLEKKKAKSNTSVGLAESFGVIPTCSESSDLPVLTVAGVGVGVGVGEGDGGGKKQQPSEAPKGARSRKPRPEKVPDPRHTEFENAFGVYFTYRNKNIQKKPWDGQEAGALAKFLAKNPSLTTEQWKVLLNNRGKSPVPHSENLSAWITRALRWLDGPTDERERRITGGNIHAKPTIAEQVIDASQQALDILRSKQLVDGEDRPGEHPQARGAGPQSKRIGDAGGVVLEASR